MKISFKALLHPIKWKSILKNNFTKDITYLAPIEVEILALRYSIGEWDCFVPRNDRLQRIAGIAFTKMRKPLAPEKTIFFFAFLLQEYPVALYI